MTDVINTGATANDHTGDVLRDAFIKINERFAVILASFNFRGDWATTAVYSATARDYVKQGGLYYLATVAHTAGVFATDLAASKWVLLDIAAALAAQDAKLAGTGAGQGSTAIGHIGTGTGAVATTVQAQLHAIQSWVLNAKDAPYLCVGDGVTDNTAKFASIRTFAATLSAAGNAVEIQIPAGRYLYSSSPNWAINRLTLRALGEVWFINTGTGQSFVLDGGATGSGVYGMKVLGDLLIHGPAGSSNGAYIRSVHTSDLNLNVRGAGTAFAGLYMEWCVSNTIRYSCNANEGGLSSTMTRGMFLTSRASDGLETSYNVFLNPQCSGMSIGAYMDGSLGNTFIGGAVQGCTNYGAQLTVNAYNNKFFGTDFEVNTNADILCDGRENSFFGVDSYTLAKFTSNALNNRLIGGAYQNITVDAGATRTALSDVTYNRFGAGTLTDNGTKTRFRDLINKGTATIENTPRARTALTVGASPYTYTNNTGNEESVMVYGGTISQLVLSRFAGDALGITAGQFTLSPGDSIAVTYSGLPVMVKWTR